jgi:ABC-2 type transport system ATP-binding protein
MSQICLDGICKSFKVSQRPQGHLSLLKSAFIRETRIVNALKDINFSIEEGELVGYIGPNGAGKSTTVKVMSGILTPDEGNCTILNRIPWKDREAHVARIGVVFGQRSQLWWDLPVSDTFSLLKDIYHMSFQDYKKRLSELAETLKINEFIQTPVRQLSLGQRMRCEIAASLLHKPDILFLDEPTIGLDAVSKLSLREFLKNENKKNGVTMILTTHDMDDIESLCSRVMVIGRGELLYDGNLDTLKNRYAPLCRIKATLFEPMEEFQIDGSEKVQVNGLEWTVFYNPGMIPTHTMVERMSKLLPLKDINIQEKDIDEIIASMYEEMCL